MPTTNELKAARLTTEELIQALKNGGRSFSIFDKAPEAGKGASNAIRDAADQYAASKGLPPLVHGIAPAKVNEARAKQIAQAFDEMKHSPNDPQVKKAYDALVNETLDQYQVLKNNGLKVSKITPDMKNPYESGSKAMLDDVHNNNHMWYYPSEQGFGSTPGASSDHPLMQMTSELDPHGQPMPANDVFRIVHDYFGHAKEGNGFGPVGEERAWRAHMQMFTPDAQKALTTETRGQNSWVNYGPHGAENKANPAKTIYADQKAGILPDHAFEVDPQQGGWSKFHTAEGPRYFKYDTGETPAVHYGKQPLEELDPAFQGTGTDQQKFMRTGKPETPYASAYKHGAEPEDAVLQRSGNVRNIVNVNPGMMYDIANDPHNYLSQAQHDMAHGNFEGNPINAEDLARTRIKAAGYGGLQRQNGFELFNKAPAMVGGFGLAGMSQSNLSPLSFLRNAFDKYEEGKDKLTGKLSDMMVPQPDPRAGDDAKQFADQTRNVVHQTANIGLDPMNALPGPAQAGAFALDAMSHAAPQGYAGGGGVAGLPAGFEVDGGSDAQAAQPMSAAGQQPGEGGHEGAGEMQLGAPIGSELPEDFVDQHDYYSTPGQQLKTLAEGAGHGILGPIAPLIEKHILGVKDEDMRQRQEENPIIHGVGEVGGLAGSAFTNFGMAPLLGHVGEAALHVAGLAGDLKTASLATKVIASAVDQGVQTAVLEGGDKISDLIMHDPETSVQTAIVDTGIASLLGAGGGAFMTGVVHPIFKATIGNRLHTALEKTVLDMKSGQDAATPDVQLKPFMRKILENYGAVKGETMDQYLAHHKAIQEMPEVRDMLDKYLEHIEVASDSVRDTGLAFTRESDTVKQMQSEMKQMFVAKGYEANLASALTKQAFKTATTQLADRIQEKALTTAPRIALATEQLRNAVVEGSGKAYDVLEKTPDLKIPLDSWMSKSVDLAHELEAEGTLEAKQQASRLRDYVGNVRDMYPGGVNGVEAKQLIQGLDKVSKYDFNATSFDKNMSRVYKDLRFELDSTLKETVPAYKKAMLPVADDTKLLTSLRKYGTDEDAVRSVGRLKNPVNFKTDVPVLEKLAKRSGDDFLADIRPHVDPKMRAALVKSLPEYQEAEHAAAVLQHLKNPATKAAMEAELQQTAQYQAMKRAEAAYEAAQAEAAKLKGITPMTLQGKLNTVAKPGKNLGLEKQMAEALPLINGKTAPELMNLMRIRDSFDADATRGSKHTNMYAGLLGGIGAMTGGVHGGIAGGGAGAQMGAFVDRNGPKVVRWMLDQAMAAHGDMAELSKERTSGAARRMMHALLIAGPQHQVSGEGFKAGTDFISAVEKGEKQISKAAFATFKASAATVPPHMIPTEAQRIKLDKLVADNQDNPDGFAQKQQENSTLGHYLPNHQVAVAETASRVQQYLAGVKPTEKRSSPLDRPMPPSEAEMARYHRAQDIAINPSIVFRHIQQGTLQATDIADLKSMYPKLYDSMSQKLSDAITQYQASEEQIPYHVRMGISLFLGQPLDSTMQPMSIMAAQPKPQGQPMPPGKAPGKPKGSPKALTKTSGMYKTPGQEAESDRSDRH